MKKIIVIIIMFTTVFGFSQKKELRNAEKRLNEGFYNEALDILSQIEGVIISSEQKYQAHYYYLLGWANKGDTNYDDAIPLLRKAIDLDNFDKYTEDAGILIDQIEIELVNLAVQDNKNEDFISASKRLYDAYLINPDKDENVNYLYFAASSSVNGNDYQVALEYYNKLKKMNYTGIVSEYFITPIETQIEEKVSETEYNLFKSSKDYTNQRVGKTESRLPEIVKNIALIYVQLGETDMAITAIEDARKIRPDDLNLLLSEADLYM